MRRCKEILFQGDGFLHSTSGMTLLEVMLATLVLAMVVAMVSLSLSGSLQTIDAALDQGGLYRRAEIALSRISEDLAGAQLVSEFDFIGERGEEGAERSDSLSFVSSSHVYFTPSQGSSGLALIQYRTEPKDDGSPELVLYRTDTLLRPLSEEETKELTASEDTGLVLCDKLRSVSFTYFDHNGDMQEIWDTEQDSEQNEDPPSLPAAVSIRLEFWLDEEEERSIPFSTKVLLPAGFVQATEREDDKTGS